MPREKSNATVRPLETMREPFESRMDVPREPPSKKRRNLLIAAAGLVLVLVTVAIARLDPAAPSVDRDAILIGTVEQGSFTRSVRGPGTLVPEQMRYVSALTAGRVEEVLVQPGTTVEAGTVLLRLSNPDVQLEALRAQQQWTAAQGTLVDLRRTLGSQRLAQEAAVAAARAEYLEAARQAEADSALAARQLISHDAAARSAEQAAALSTRLRTEEERFQLVTATMGTELAVQADQVERLHAIYDYQERRVESMDVTAGA
ncbi:MAG: biotin/lipoyl-binding protein, partial [Gemmatimonadota bacterium]